ncbi:hypothetical protein J4P02_13865 [Pseudomonas sp. NFXW11]|uniref:hypothetical protein n=1 Tax=Pseudomonas sp. NFXW11 TaxID=2819531 RepID=UPI003CEA3BBD
MNSALLLLNATAVAVLMALHFQPAGQAISASSLSLHYSPRQTAQLAVMNQPFEPSLLSQSAQPSPQQQPAAASAERWVF